MYTIFFYIFLITLALHVSGASRTHHQEHNCSVQRTLENEYTQIHIKKPPHHLILKPLFSTDTKPMAVRCSCAPDDGCI
jgi:hypothetical protein